MIVTRQVCVLGVNERNYIPGILGQCRKFDVNISQVFITCV